MRRILRDPRFFELRRPYDSRICICRCVLYFFTLFFGVNERVRLRYDDIPLGCFYFSICLIERAAAWNNVNMGEFGIWAGHFGALY